MANIGYGKIGRSFKLPLNEDTRGTATGGDSDVRNTLFYLASDNPHHNFFIISKNSGENPQEVGYPENVINLWNKDFSKQHGRNLRAYLKEHEYPGCNINGMIHTFQHETLHEYLFGNIDECILWLGQHGSANSPIPLATNRERESVSQGSFVRYVGYLLTGADEWLTKQREKDEHKDVIWLCPDVRNNIKFRDMKNPVLTGVLAQYYDSQKNRYERFGDKTEPQKPFEWKADGQGDCNIWEGPVEYVYSGIEMTALNELSTYLNPQMYNPLNLYKDKSFGIVLNENKKNTKNSRKQILKEFVLDTGLDTSSIFGVWSDESKLELGLDIEPIHISKLYYEMSKWKSTLTTPASGSGWATSKPWECFLNGVVCFFHKDYDSQGHIVSNLYYKWGEDFNDSPYSKELGSFLRVSSPEELKKKVDMIDHDEDLRIHYVTRQFLHLKYCLEKYQRGIKMINERIN